MEPDSGLDTELAGLPSIDLAPGAARALRLAATQRLVMGRPRSRLARVEGSVLLGLATTQLIWALLRVYELSGH